MTALPDPIGTIEVIDVFVYYEEPLLFTARSQRGEVFLVVLAQDSDDEQVWHFARVSPGRLSSLRSRTMHLRDAFLLAEGGHVIALHREKARGGGLRTESLVAATLTDDVLPAAGEFLW